MGAGFPLGQGVGSHRLAEGEEGLSEDFKGVRKKYNLDRVVHSKSETICQRWHTLASEYIGHIVSVRSTVPHEVKVEISEAWVVGSSNSRQRSFLKNEKIKPC